MANRVALLLLLQTCLVFLVLAWSLEGARGEESEDALSTSTGELSFVKRRLAESNYNPQWTSWGGPWGRGSSCVANPSKCKKENADLECCGYYCVSTQTDYFHCGRCGKECKSYERCCGGKCVNMLSDPHNCGQCGMKCPKDKCRWGVCGYNGVNY